MANQENEIRCPTCPMCGAEPPYIIPALAQAICPNEDCPVVLWVPWQTKEANLADVGKVRHFIDGVEQP
jgi:hypothetical protein